MKKVQLVIGLCLALFLVACSSSKKELRNEIEYREKLFADGKIKGNHVPNRSDYYLLIETYEDFINAYPEDSACSMYSYKMGLKWVELNKFDKAVAVLMDIPEEYPNFRKNPEIIFFTGFLYEEKMGNNQKAIETYKHLMEKFPNHKLAKDARTLIMMIEQKGA